MITNFRGLCTAPRHRTALLIHNEVACVLVLGNHNASAKAILDPLAGFDVSAKVLSLYMIGYDATCFYASHYGLPWPTLNLWLRFLLLFIELILHLLLRCAVLVFFGVVS